VRGGARHTLARRCGSAARAGSARPVSARRCRQERRTALQGRRRPSVGRARV
jgi:hypothetical protein